MKELFFEVEEYLAQNVTNKNVVACLKEANMIGSSPLKKACLEVLKNSKRQDVKGFESLGMDVRMEIFDYIQSENRKLAAKLEDRKPRLPTNLRKKPSIPCRTLT